MTLNKKRESDSGLQVRSQDLRDLYSHTQRAKGILATLELEQTSAWTKKCSRTAREHLRILLQDVMEEIFSMETILNQPLNRKQS